MANCKKVGIAAGKEALKAGSEATRDYVNEGVDFKTALKRRGKQTLGRTISNLGQELQKGSGFGRRPFKKSIKGIRRRSRIRNRKLRKRDIYDG